MIVNQKWVFLRGLSRSQFHWGTFLETFRTRFPHHALQCLEIPGNGIKYREKSPLHPHLLLKDLSKQLEHPEEKVWGVGISMGGMALLKWAGEEPSRFYGLILINISLPRINPFYYRLQRDVLRKAPLLFGGSPNSKEEIIFDLTSQRPSQKQATLKAWAKIEQAYPFQKFNFIRQLILASRLYPPAVKPEIPVLLVSSQGDRLVDPRCSKQIQAHYQFDDIAIHPTAGHDLPLDEPDWLIEKIALFQKKYEFK